MKYLISLTAQTHDGNVAKPTYEIQSMSIEQAAIEARELAYRDA